MATATTASDDCQQTDMRPDVEYRLALSMVMTHIYGYETRDPSDSVHVVRCVRDKMVRSRER